MNKKTITTSKPLVKDIIFIHGITSFGASHIEICKVLTKLGYNFHLFDLPGHGAKRKEWETHKFTFNDMLDFVNNYIDTKIKGKPFIIMGHSMGGGITLATCAKYKSQIKAVILECPLTPAVYNHTEDKGKVNFKDVKINLAKYRRMLKDN
jgi:alpha-beta hydrolase superfamily lysophospholipase